MSVYRKPREQERDHHGEGTESRTPSFRGVVILTALVLLLSGAAPARADGPTAAGEISAAEPAEPGASEAEPSSLPEESATVEAWSYTPGRGLRLGTTGVTLGGYASMNLTRNEGSRGRLQLDDLSVFVLADPVPHLHFFAELEVEDAWTIDDHGDTAADGRFAVERLYADVSIADTLTLRGGVFLTPVGRWNVIHAAPLVWTTSRPLTTEVPFDPRSTGLMAFGTVFPGDGALTYSLFGQVADPIEGNPDFDPANGSVGGRLEYTTQDEQDEWSIGGTYLAADRDDGWRHLAGVDLLWSHDRLELMGEFAYDDGPSGAAQWGVYLQAALRIAPKTYIVERYEHFSPRTSARDLNLVASGLAYRLRPNVILKSEYLAADRSGDDAEAGFKASIAILF